LYKKNSKEQHIKEAHVIVFCECGEEVDKSRLKSHKENNCPHRITKCSFCPLDMPYIEIWSHEQTCGAKTNKCDKCNQWIKKKDWDLHYQSCGKDVPQYKEPTPQKPTFGDFIPCPYCSTPFVEWDELQIHILITHPTEAEHFTTGGNENENENENENNQSNNTVNIQSNENINTNENIQTNENVNTNDKKEDMDTSNDN